MKTAKKAIFLVLCAVLLVAGSVMGTLAYLQMKTETVTNTFTVGKVSITLQEYELIAETGKQKKNDEGQSIATSNGIDNIKLVPGRKIEKNPFITVAEGSEDCYIYVCIENGLGTDITIEKDSGWTEMQNGYFAYKEKVSAEKNIDVFTSIQCSESITNSSTWGNNTIKITAYAVQAEGFDTPEAAWNATFGATSKESE